MVLQGCVNVVDWIRQEFCKQIEEGEHSVEVGWDEEGRCRTKSGLDYYIDDGCEATM